MVMYFGNTITKTEYPYNIVNEDLFLINILIKLTASAASDIFLTNER